MKKLIAIGLAIVTGVMTTVCADEASSQPTPQKEVTGSVTLTTQYFNGQSRTRLNTSIHRMMERFGVMLDQLSKYIKTHAVKNKQALVRELDLLSAFAESLVAAGLENMTEEEVAELIKKTEQIVKHIKQSVDNEDIAHICHVEIIPANSAEKAERFDIKDLKEVCNKIESSINDVIEQLRELNLNSFQKAVHSIDRTIKAYHINTIAHYSWPYLLCGLYILRQHREDKVPECLKWLKAWVGSPCEKKPVLNLDALVVREKNIQAHEIADWAKNNGYKLNADYDGTKTEFEKFLGHFPLKIEDGEILKLPLGLLFSYRVFQDAKDLYAFVQKKWNEVAGFEQEEKPAEEASEAVAV